MPCFGISTYRGNLHPPKDVLPALPSILGCLPLEGLHQQYIQSGDDECLTRNLCKALYYMFLLLQVLWKSYNSSAAAP
jgi:hypothetical protein